MLARLQLLICALAAGCVSADWSRDSRLTPPPLEAPDVLVEGETSLAQALELMGAPLHVYEYRQTGVALAFGWYAADSRGIRVSVPVYNQFSASVDYSDTDEGLDGLLLLFDEDLRLERIRRGWLADLTVGLRRQSPAVLEERQPTQEPTRQDDQEPEHDDEARNRDTTRGVDQGEDEP